MPIHRLLLLACLLWLVSFVASPSAGGAQTSKNTRNPHQDLSLFTSSENCVAAVGCWP